MVIALLLVVTALQAYVFGGINGAIITSKYFYRKDIRKYGSGNAGLTNFYRVFGKGGALLVVIIDVLKTVGPVFVGGYLFAHFLDPSTFVSGNVGFFNLSFFGSEYAGFFVTLGHCFPLFYEFRGGKGVMAMGTVVFFIDWRVALVAWGTFLVVLAITRYVSLGAVIGVLTYPVTVALLGFGGVWEMIVAVLTAALLVFRHKDNLKRVFAGTESKFSFRRKKQAQ